jgi:hypothetical protein
MVVVVGLAIAGIASCGIDESGLGSMPFLPHDASSGDATGSAGASGSSGSAGAGAGGSAVGGAAGTSIAGSGGAAGEGATSGAAGGPAGQGGQAGADSGAAGSGAAGTGAAGSGAGGDVAGAGGSSNAGSGGSAGIAGSGAVAGTDGTAGSGGSAGGGGSAGTGGRGAAGGTGGAAGGRGGTGGVVIPCNSSTCSDGCCKDSTTCIRMRSASQCGAQGAACAACPGCNICSTTGQCRIDPASRWKILAVSAQLDSGPWDRANGDVGGSLPDPFCEYENPAGQVTTATAGVTDTLTDTRNPMWNQEINPPGMTVAASTLMANSPAWQIWVGDDDGCKGPGGCLGDVACTIRQTITEDQLRAGKLTVSNRQSCNQVVIGLVCQPLFPSP